MSLYLLAVTPLTFYAACALLRERSPIVTLDLWRRFALGALLALPGYLMADVLAGWFGASYRPLALYARLTVTLHLVPAALAVAAALAVGLSSSLAARAGRPAGANVLTAMATMAGFGSIYVAAELAGSGVPPSAVQLLIVPTLRVATLIALIIAWALRDRALPAAAIAATAVPFAGAVSYLHAVGFHAPAAVLTGVAAATGAAALVSMRRSA